MLINTPCKRCGTLFDFPVDDTVAQEPMLREYALRAAVCPACMPEVRRETADNAKRELMAERESQLQATYAERLKASRLDTQYLGFDVNHPNANRSLYDLVGHNVNRSLWISGKTGLGKTRVMQYYAKKLLKNRSVLYFRAFDLMAMLSEDALNLDSAMRPIYEADLLIIDDLGKEVMSPAKAKYLFAIIDRRYIGHNRACRIQHTDDPEYYFPQPGAQLWVSTQDDGSGLASSYNRSDSEALFRRISAICHMGVL